MLSNILRYHPLLLVFLLILCGCKVAQVNLPQAQPIPQTFTGSADTVSIGTLPLKEFFNDPHLISLIDTALQKNFDLRVAVQRIEMARANLRLGKGALLPSVNAVASAGADKYGEYTLNGVGNYDTNLSENIGPDRRIPTDPTPDYFLGLRSSWEVDIWGKLRNGKKAAFARLLASEKGQQLITTSLVAEVASLYYELLALDYQLDIVRKNIIFQQTVVELITIQKEGGRTTELAVQQSTAQLLNTRALEVKIQQEIIALENTLNFLLGRFPQPIQRENTLLSQAIPSVVSAGVPSAMLRHRPDIQQAELELEAAKADLQAARAAFFPSLTITSYAGFNAFKSGLLFDPGSLALGVLGGLSAPIFSHNRIQSQYKRSSAENIAAVYAYQKAIVNGFREVATGLKSIENLNLMYNLKNQEVTVLRNAVTTANDLFVAGYASYLEVITAQRNVLEAELGLANTRKEQFLSIIDLYRALGGGWQ